MNAGYVHEITCTVTSQGGQLRDSVKLHGESSDLRNLPLAAGAKDKKFDISFVPERVVSLMITSGEPLTIKVNDAKSPDVTLTIKPGAPFVWHVGCHFPNPFKKPVTALFVTNDGGALVMGHLALLWNASEPDPEVKTEVAPSEPDKKK